MINFTIINHQDDTSKKTSIDLDIPEIKIGRADDNDIILSSPYVSAHHGYIKLLDNTLFYVDLNSSNGSFINTHKVKKSGEKVYPCKYTLGDKLFVGNIDKGQGCELTYVISTNSASNELEISNEFNRISNNKSDISSLVVLSIEEGNNTLEYFPMTSNMLEIGRKTSMSECQIQINNSSISKLQASIVKDKNTYMYYEKGSNHLKSCRSKDRFKDSVNGVNLVDNELLYIGRPLDDLGVFLFFTSKSYYDYEWKLYVDEGKEISIGRSKECIIKLPQLTVSRKHAIIKKKQDLAYICDNKSINGILLNNTVVKGETALRFGDEIKIGSNMLIYLNKYIIYATPKNIVNTQNTDYSYLFKGGIEVSLSDVSRLVTCKQGTGIDGGNKKYILQNVTCTIHKGQLVAILGGSGAGKTTFMNCINGFEPATSGTVEIDGKDLYANYEVLKHHMGYVPQQDIVHEDLTLESMLTFVARLRLSDDINKEEIKEKVKEVIRVVDMSQHSKTFISKLSGGQKKRASIAVELLSDPDLFFLDEPTSGLDPEAETNLMKRLRFLSDSGGKTVIVITHTLQNIRMFDKVVFLASGGKLCFYGSPEDALSFFKVTNLSDAYEKIKNDVDGYVNKYKNQERD